MSQIGQLEATYSLPLVKYVSGAEATKINERDVLWKVGFGPQDDSSEADIQTGLSLLEENTPKLEYWLSSFDIEKGHLNGMTWSRDSSNLVVGAYIEETGTRLEDATYHTYRKLLEFVAKERDYRIVRIWNYIPRINEDEHELERYKSFSVGRFNAFSDASYSDNDFSSACAVGSDGRKGVVYLLACKNDHVNFENPNQISAFKYPPAYGPKSPSFARATLVKSDPATFFISGTASISGSETMHIDDLASQINLTGSNIRKLIEVATEFQESTSQPDPYIVKVYVRNPDAVQQIRSAVEKMFSDNTSPIFLRGDICRQELLVEIDGICFF